MSDETAERPKPREDGQWCSEWSQGITGPTSCEWHFMPGWHQDRYQPVIKIGGAGPSSASVIAVVPKADPDWERNAALIASAPSLASERDAARQECDRLKAELSSLKSSASRPVLPENFDERAFRTKADHCRNEGYPTSSWNKFANDCLALLDAFTSPPPSTETGEAEREEDPTADFCRAFARLYLAAGHAEAKARVAGLASVLIREARP